MPRTSEITKKRLLGFLIWQSIPSTLIYFLSKTLILSPLTPNLFSISLSTPLCFLTFHLSLLLFSHSLSSISSPYPTHPASLTDLASYLARFLLNSLLGNSKDSNLAFSNHNFRLRVKTSLGFAVFVICCGVAGCLSVVAFCGNLGVFEGLKLVELGFRGLVFGLVYGVHYVYFNKRVLVFPVIQRAPFFSFKMGLPSAVREALKLSALSFFCSALVVVFLPNQFKGQRTVWKFITEQIIFYVGSITVSLCWELGHHLHQVLHTKRCIFAPPKGSAAAETNPSEPLLAALEESAPKSLLQYLAYLDLCMTCETNVDTWRRAAFSEESGETYRRVVTVCLRPLEQMTSKLAEGLEGSSMENTDKLSHQLRPPSNIVNETMLYEALNDYQLCAWCARTLSALTAQSHNDDQFGVAQLSGCNAAVITTLLSCLLAVEACMGKKTNLQAPQLMGPTGIKWAPLNTIKRDGAVGIVSQIKGGPLHGKSYAMADVLRTSIYMIVTVFCDEMMGSTKAGNLEDWIVGSKPLYGTRDIIVQKLGHFQDFRSS